MPPVNPSSPAEQRPQDVEKVSSNTVHEVEALPDKSRLPSEHGADLAEVLNYQRSLDQVERKALIEQAEKWVTNGDFDLLRAAGISLEEIKKDPLKLHQKLMAMFLSRDTSTPDLVFKYESPGKNIDNNDIDLAIILPPNVLCIDILDKKGNKIITDAKRGISQMIPGYFYNDTANGGGQSRVDIKDGYSIVVKETQSSVAIKDERKGQETHQRAFELQAYQTQNAQKQVIKKKTQEKAKEYGMKVTSDRSFFDVFLGTIINNLNNDGKTDPEHPLNFSPEDISTLMIALLGEFGFKIPGATNAKELPELTAEEKRKLPEVFDKTTKPISEAARKAPKIGREWLLENVGRNNKEVQKFMVKTNFLGVKLRVNKLIVPYLFEAEERLSEQGINYRAKPGQTSCQNWRPIRGGSALSMHSWGTAIDINSLENPYQPHLKKNQNRAAVKKTIPQNFVAVMRDVGFKTLWWDPMHFELAVNPYNSQNLLKSQKAKDAATQFLA